MFRTPVNRGGWQCSVVPEYIPRPGDTNTDAILYLSGLGTGDGFI